MALQTFNTFLAFKLILITGIFLNSNSVLGQNKYVNKAKDCYLKNKINFENCLLRFWEDLRPLMKTGVPELNVPIMDPLFINLIDFNEQSPAVQVSAKLTNLHVVGASNIVPVSVKVDKKLRMVTVNIRFPFLNATGIYNIQGTVLVLPVNGEGRFTLNMTGIDAVVKSTVIQRGKGIKTDTMTLDFTIKSLFLQLHRTTGNDAVGDAITNMLNDNSQQILQDIKPLIAKRFEQTFLNLTGDAFADMPFEAFIA